MNRNGRLLRTVRLHLKNRNALAPRLSGILCCLFALGLGVTVVAQSYPPPFPVNYGDKSVIWPGWSEREFWRYIDPSDPASPRFTLLLADEDESVSFDAALDATKAFVDLNVVQVNPVKVMQVASEIVPETIAFTMGESKLARQDAVFFIHMERRTSDGLINVWFFEAPKETFRTWGGSAAMLIAFGFYDTAIVRDEGLLNEVGNASFAEQMAFYEEIFTLNLQDIMMGIIAAQSGTLSVLQELNFDLLFDGEVNLFDGN